MIIKYKAILLFGLVFTILSCTTKNNNVTKIYNFKGIKFYEIKCGEKIYFSLQEGNCNSMPSSYIYPKGDSENYFCIFLRIKNKKLELYSPYNDLVKFGNISDQIKIFEYKTPEDNLFIEDSIKGKSYSIDGTTSL